MKKTILNSVLILGIFFFSGCSMKEYKLFQTGTVKEEQTTKITPEDYQKELAYENKIAPNDRLSITVYVQSGQGSQQMSSILTTNSNNNTTSRDDDIGILVTQNGTVRLPMLGSVEIIGLTEDEASAKLIELYKTYIRNPYVKVEMTEKQFEKLCKAVYPHLKAIQEALKGNGEEMSASISVGSDGYLNFHPYNSDWELSKFKDSQATMKYEHRTILKMEEDE